MNTRPLRYRLEELMEEYFALQPDSKDPVIPKGFERYKFGGWCCSDKIFEKAGYYDEQGEKVSKKRAKKRCTAEGYPIDERKMHHVWSFVQAIQYKVKGIEQLRVCRAFETRAINVKTNDREYSHTIYSDTVVEKADFQQIPALHLDCRYVNPEFWRQYNKWNRKQQPGGINRRQFEALITLYADDLVTELSETARSYALTHQPDSPKSREVFFIDSGISRISNLPRGLEPTDYPDWYPDRSKQFKKKPVHYLVIGLLNLYPFRLLDERFNPKYPIIQVHLRGPSAKKDDELRKINNLRYELERLERLDADSLNSDKKRQERKEELKALIQQ